MHLKLQWTDVPSFSEFVVAKKKCLKNPSGEVCNLTRGDTGTVRGLRVRGGHTFPRFELMAEHQPWLSRNHLQ